MSAIADNLCKTLTRVADAALAAGRSPDEVKLLAVSKTFGVEAVAQAVAAGQHHFGENYLQEALGKLTAMPELCWHFTGTIQSNKARQIATHFDWIHTLASAKAAGKLNDARDDLPLTALIQVNISGEASKSGLAPENLDAFVEFCLPLERLKLAGLMAIPAPSTDVRQQRAEFRRLRVLRDQVQQRFGLEGFTELSMGMSKDYAAAIMEGATWVRVGEGIFGPRPVVSKT